MRTSGDVGEGNRSETPEGIIEKESGRIRKNKIAQKKENELLL